MAEASRYSQHQLERISAYVARHFTLRRCNRYVRINIHTDITGNNVLFKPDDCVCGRPYNWHVERNYVGPVSLDASSNVRVWSLANDTYRHACNAYGRLLFVPGPGFVESSIVPWASAVYLRLPGDSSPSYMEDVYTLMTSPNLWALPPPGLIIEVAGMERKLQHIDPEILDRFSTGLIRAAKTAKAWLVTGGTNSGLMGLVGEAISKTRMTHPGTKITCVGIASWGIVNNRHQLVTVEESESNGGIANGGSNGIAPVDANDVHLTATSTESLSLPVYRNASNGGKLPHPNLTPNYTVERPENCKDGNALNAAHDCFLFIDNGRHKQFGEEVDFKFKFLNYLSQKTLHVTGGTTVTTPMVLLVVGGGPIVLKTVELSVASGKVCHNHGNRQSQNLEQSICGGVRGLFKKSQSLCCCSRPVVVLPHFGGLSDLLAFAYEITAPPTGQDLQFCRSSSKPNFVNEEAVFPPDFDQRIKGHAAFSQILQFIPEHVRAEEAETALKRIRNCLEHRSLMTVVDLSADYMTEPLDHAILNAILKSNLGPVSVMFELAQLWNRIDVAEQLLGCYEAEIRQHINIASAASRAVTHGQSDFFKLLVDYGLIDLYSYLNLRQIRSFYVDIFLRCQGKAKKSACIWFFRSLLLNNITEKALCDATDPTLLANVGNILSAHFGRFMENAFTEEKSYKSRGSGLVDGLSHFARKDLKPYETSRRDLFILQLLLHRTDLATYLWKIGHDHLGTALMAAIFLKSLSKEAKRLDMTDLGNAYLEDAKEWQDRAVLLLSHCYENDPSTCSRLLIRSLFTWQGATLLEMAFIGNMKEFMEQPAVQTTLAQIWRGKMATFTSQPLIYLTTFPLFLPFLIFRIRFETVTLASSIFSTDAMSALSPTRLQRRNALTSDRIDAERPALSNVQLQFRTASHNQQDIKLTRASLFRFYKENNISVITAVCLLYSSPIAKYVVHSFSTVIFLFTFSLFVLNETLVDNITVFELYIWVSCTVYFLDVLRQEIGKTNLSFLDLMIAFYSRPLVLADTFTFALVTAAWIMRFFYSSSVDFVYPHTTYALACIFYWIKSMRFFFVIESVGPKVLTLVKMFRDLAFFIVIYVILLFTFSLPIYSLLYPHQHLTGATSYFSLLQAASYSRMWDIFLVAMDDSKRLVEGTCASLPANVTTPAYYGLSRPTTCSSRNIVAVALYAIFLLLTNIMLLNMLIAMFSHTVNKTRLSATRRWRFDMYRFLCEYYNRPVLPGPFMLFELSWRFIVFMYQKTWAREQLPQNTDLKHFYAAINCPEYRMLEMFEKSATEVLLTETASKNQSATASSGAKMRLIGERIHGKLDRIEAMLAETLSRRF